MKFAISSSLFLIVFCLCMITSESRIASRSSSSSSILFGTGELGHSSNDSQEDCPWQRHCERICYMYRRGCEARPLTRPCDEMTGARDCSCSCRYTESESHSPDDSSSHASSSSEDSDD